MLLPALLGSVSGQRTIADLLAQWIAGSPIASLAAVESTETAAEVVAEEGEE